MTKVPYGHSAQHQIARRTRTSAATGPHLAGNRNENLLNSRSCTPSDDDVSMSGDVDSTPASMGADTDNVADSPASERFSSSLASFSPANFPTPSTSRASAHQSASPQHSGDIPIRQGPPRSELPPLAEEPGNGDTVLTHLVNRDQLSWSYTPRAVDGPHHSPADTESPPTNVTSPPTSLSSVTTGRRPSESTLRPLAKRPPGTRHGSEDHKLHEQLSRTAAGKRKGVKKPYENPEQREKVKAVRAHGACLRCQIMRQACEVTEDGQSCTNCGVSRRKFNLPCTRMLPGKRWKYLFPDLLVARLNHRYLPAIEGQERPDAFRLPLTHVSGFALQLNVVEAPESHLPRAGCIKSFFVGQGEGSDLIQTLTKEMSLPLIPVISTSFKDVAEWLAKQINDTITDRLRDLPIKVFPEEKEQFWPRSVLALVGDFYDQVYLSPRIHKVLKTMVVRHLMSRRFYIPFDQMSEVNAQLSLANQRPEEEIEERRREERCWTPKFINRYIKAALMHLLNVSLKNDFAELEELFKLHEKSPGGEICDLDRDEAFCYIAVVLVIVSIMQIKIMEVAQSRDEEASHECPFGRQTNNTIKAKTLIQNVEDEVIDHILGLWTYKFVKCHRKGRPQESLVATAQRAAGWGLLERFHETMQKHADRLDDYTVLTLNLDDGHVPRFLVDNPTRVLLRFARTLAPARVRKSQQQPAAAPPPPPQLG